MSINVQQLIVEAQKMANRNKELVALSNSLLVEAESNNRTLEAMRQFQDDMDSLNKLARNKSNSDMINRINQQNPSIRETRNENRELKATLEDHQRVLEMVMQKYRDHTQQHVFKSQVNFKELYNEKLLEVIKKQAEKINEMAAIMQKAAQADDDDIHKELEWNSKLKTENQSLRELLQIANDFESSAVLRSGICAGGIAIDDDKHNILLHSQIATSSTSSGYGSASNATSIQSSRVLCRPCEDKAIQTEFTQQQQQAVEKSLDSTLNKSLDEDDEDQSVIENKQINSIQNDNADDETLLNTIKILNEVLENGNELNALQFKNKKITLIENNAEHQNGNGKKSNNNSPNKKQQKQLIEKNSSPKTKQQQNEESINNENNKNNLTATKQNSENIKKLSPSTNENNIIVETTDLPKLNFKNGLTDENDDQQKEELSTENDTRSNISAAESQKEPTNKTAIKSENQENNNKSSIS